VAKIEELFAGTTQPGRAASKDWLLIGDASHFLRVHRTALYGWRRKGCPLLGGRKIKTRWNLYPPTGEGHVRVLEFWRKDLEAIRDAQAAGGVLDGDHDRWPTAAEALEQFGYYPERLKSWKSEGCPFLGGEKLQSSKRIRIGKTGKPCPAVVYSLPQLKEISARRAELDRNQATADRIPYHQVRSLFPAISRDTLYRWQNKGCPWLDGQKLTAHRENVPTDENGFRTIWTYSRRQLQEIDRKMAAENDSRVIRDEQGTWRFVVDASERYGLIPQHLERWRTSPCRALGRRTIRAKQVEVLWLGKRHGGKAWVYHDEDLRTIAAGQPSAGTTTRRPAASPTDHVSDSPAPHPSGTEQLIINCIREFAPIQGKEIANELGFPFNSYFRQIVSRLVKQGLIHRSPDGYRL
jgi:hypothetical protein